ncbi:phage head morphogenesis protein [Aeromonas hydrophila]|uniref:phage head morphogenesis protein n=1 Tax=Aeromonas hydrophila TaxID=644 RepID=UPI002B055582|nr:phage minor head protein [Aeromonas hydrophila]
MVKPLTLQESIILKCRIAHALACLEEVEVVTLAYVKTLEALCDHTSRREIDEARKELGELWSAVYIKADKEALTYLHNQDIRIERAAAQWQRIQRTKRAMPYLIYQLGPRRETCEQHLQWDGVLLPVDDSWWLTHMPPNSWGCTCWVRQISKFEYQKILASGKARTSATDDGIEPGWDFNPGLGNPGV